MADREWYQGGLQFMCTQCGNCCTGPPGYVWVNEAETTALAKHFDLSVDQFRAAYAHKIYGRWSLNETPSGDGFDCVFLERDQQGKALCNVYDARPTQCRTWPFWPENLKSSTAWNRNTQTCPGSNTGKLYPIDQIRIQRDRTKL